MPFTSQYISRSTLDIAVCILTNTVQHVVISTLLDLQLQSLQVAATMICAHLAGIHIFATGGVGGVHRGVNDTMDISADLTELSRTPVTVISAGIKSILDIGRTLEFLETSGVAVMTLGSNEFPAFFTRKSGCKTPCREDSLDQCAAIIEASHTLQLQSGQLITIPIPSDLEAKADVVTNAINTALQEVKERHILGSVITPYVLDRVNQLPGGESLRSNIALIKNNVKIAAIVQLHATAPYFRH